MTKVTFENDEIDKSYIDPEFAIVASGCSVDADLACDVIMHSERTSNVFLGMLILKICKSFQERLPQGSTLDDIFSILKRFDADGFWTEAMATPEFLESIQDQVQP